MTTFKSGDIVRFNIPEKYIEIAKKYPKIPCFTKCYSLIYPYGKLISPVELFSSLQTAKRPYMFNTLNLATMGELLGGRERIVEFCIRNNLPLTYEFTTLANNIIHSLGMNNIIFVVDGCLSGDWLYRVKIFPAMIADTALKFLDIEMVIPSGMLVKHETDNIELTI